MIKYFYFTGPVIRLNLHQLRLCIPNTTAALQIRPAVSW